MNIENTLFPLLIFTEIIGTQGQNKSDASESQAFYLGVEDVTIYSPGYPALYNPGYRFYWKITHPSHSTIEVSFINVDISSDDDCILYKDRNNVTFQSCYAEKNCNPFTTTEPVLNIQFRSFPNSPGGSFAMKLHLLPNETVSTTIIQASEKDELNASIIFVVICVGICCVLIALVGIRCCLQPSLDKSCVCVAFGKYLHCSFGRVKAKEDNLEDGRSQRGWSISEDIASPPPSYEKATDDGKF